MPRFPLIPTLIVGIAIAAMIALGVWQLDRRTWKHELIATYTRNLSRPPIAFPRFPVGEENLYRKAAGFCLEPVAWSRRGGRSANGTAGYRLIAQCRTGGAEGPGMTVAMGVTSDPQFTPGWRGGEVTGTIVPAPTDSSLIAGLIGGRAPTQLMLVADTPAPGLAPNATPDPREIPDNHLAYAVQWFFFAIVAGVIYVLALRRRQKKSVGGEQKG